MQNNLNKKLINFVLLLTIISLINTQDVPINNQSFDTRENFNDYAFDAYYNDDYGIPVNECGTNLHITFSLYVSDRINIFNPKTETQLPLSPMNLITCLNKPTKFNCSNKYDTVETITADVNKLVTFINENGAQSLTTYPYVYDKESGDFDECKEFQSEIKESFTMSEDGVFQDSEVDKIKQVLYTKGNVLAVFNARQKLVSYRRGLYVPDDSPFIGYMAIRIFGWKEIQGKVYWVFSFTGKDNFGISRQGLVETGLLNATVFNFKLEEKKTGNKKIDF